MGSPRKRAPGTAATLGGMSEARRGVIGFAEDAQAWRAAVGPRVPVYDRLLDAAAGLVEAPASGVERAARERLEAAWRERRYTAAYDRPLLLMAALRAEAARVGDAHPLAAALIADPPRPEAATRAALAEALAAASARLHVELATRAVQTNETSRALIWLWPAALAGCDGGARPLALADIGCSAGLNLVGDGLPRLWHDGAGAPLPTAAAVQALERLGYDARPLDVERAEDVAWLRACIWPGETARLERLDLGIAAFQRAVASGGPGAPRIELAGIEDVPAPLEQAASRLPPEAVLIAYQSVVRDYLPVAARERHLQAMQAWMAGAAGATRVFVELELAPDGAAQLASIAGQPIPMLVTAHVADDVAAPGPRAVRTLILARCGYHPTLVVPDDDAVATFARLVRRKI